jgi:hypothetical protein
MRTARHFLATAIVALVFAPLTALHAQEQHLAILRDKF